MEVQLLEQTNVTLTARKSCVILRQEWQLQLHTQIWVALERVRLPLFPLVVNLIQRMVITYIMDVQLILMHTNHPRECGWCKCFITNIFLVLITNQNILCIFTSEWSSAAACNEGYLSKVVLAVETTVAELQSSWGYKHMFGTTVSYTCPNMRTVKQSVYSSGTCSGTPKTKTMDLGGCFQTFGSFYGKYVCL